MIKLIYQLIFNLIYYSGSWNYISDYSTLSEEFIKKFRHKVNWDKISKSQKLSEDFIREFSDKVNWYNISWNQQLSEDFIREFKDKVHWDNISTYQKLSEEFIREFQDKLNWNIISEFQELSENFIREFKDKIDYSNISKYQKLSPEFIKEFDLTISEYCWINKSKEFKEDYIRKNTDYEIKDGKVIAYKATRIDGSSVFNPYYKYEVGKEYTSKADYNIDNDNSYGLSAWTIRGSLGYYIFGRIFKVEIDIDDIAAITLGTKKIRAKKIKVVNRIANDSCDLLQY